MAGLLPAPKAHSDRPGFGHLDRAGHAGCLTSDGRSRAPRHRRGECQLEDHGRLNATAAQLTSLPSQQTVRRPTTCLSRSLPTRCASSCRTSTRGLVCACRAWSATGTFDAVEFFAPGRLVWLGRRPRGRRSSEIRRSRCGLLAAVGLGIGRGGRYRGSSGGRDFNGSLNADARA